jgi:hypothetical protein
MQAALDRFRAKLQLHTASHFREIGAYLPRCNDDPNPMLTLALHDLWAAMREFGPPSADSSEIFYFGGIISKPRDAPFEVFGAALASTFLSLFL